MTETARNSISQKDIWSELSAFLSTQMGLYFPKERHADLKRAITAAASAFNMANAETCAHWLLQTPLTKHQIETLASYLTIGETYFFRDKKSFQILEENIIPGLIQSRQDQKKRLRIWSAACCTGEEAYSIAISLTRTIPNLRDWDITILATDISPLYLHRASLGIYKNWSFRNIPDEIKKKFFIPHKEGGFEIIPSIKSMVTFSYLNLVDDNYPSLGNHTNAMDIIFCRNVLMYFEPSQIKKVIQKLSLSLMDGGWLLLNPCEITSFELPQLTPYYFLDTIVHRKTTEAQSAQIAQATEQLSKKNQKSKQIASNLTCQQSQISTSSAKKNPVSKNQFYVSENINIQVPPIATLYEEGNYEEAVKKGLQTLSAGSSDAVTMALLAKCYANLGNLGQARIWCQKAIARDKLNVDWHYLHAAILQELKLDKEAGMALRNVLYLDQNHIFGHLSLGYLMRRQSNLNEASRHFIQASTLLKNYPSDQTLPESEGITAGTLSELIHLIISEEL